MTTLSPNLEMIISARERDLGGFSVRRVLPYASHRMVGPFIFFDHMGPAVFAPGTGIDVRPHPHINLATVTYLFEGKIRHRDSLGSDQLIEPGAVNWMTAGRGIVHSERTPADVRAAGTKMNGIQLWVALPEEHEEMAPAFSHHPKATLPEFSVGDVAVKLLLGRAFGYASPVPVHSDLFYAEVVLPAGAEFLVAAEGRDSAIYVVDGDVDVDGTRVGRCEMAIARGSADLLLRGGSGGARVMVLGGSSVGERFIYWNFVSSSKERLEAAKREWLGGPRDGGGRFGLVPGDDQEFIPLPDEPGQVKGSVM